MKHERSSFAAGNAFRADSQGRAGLNFYERVYEVVKRIPEGKVATYGDIAAFIGAPRASRAVGYALHANPDPENIPCFRVVNREGKLSCAFAFGGMERQRALLEADGVEVCGNKVDLNKYKFCLEITEL